MQEIMSFGFVKRDPLISIRPKPNFIGDVIRFGVDCPCFRTLSPPFFWLINPYFGVCSGPRHATLSGIAEPPYWTLMPVLDSGNLYQMITRWP